MAQTTIAVNMDNVLMQDFERLCDDVGLDVNSVFTMFVKQSVRKHALPLTMEGDKYRRSKEELLRRVARAEAGHCFEVTMEELEALENEEPGGPTFQRIEQRRKAVKVDE